MQLSDILKGVHLSGTQQAPALVLLHSSMSSARQWRPLCASLASHFRLINIDLFGYGDAPQASGCKGFSLSHETDRIQLILEELAVTEFSLLGHSYGGAVALKMAYDHSSRVNSLQLFEPVAFHLLKKGCPARLEVETLASNMDSLSKEQAAASFVDYWNGEGFFARCPSSMQQLFCSQVAKVGLDFQALINEPNGLEQYATLPMPTQLLSGRQTRQSAKNVAQSLLSVQPSWQYHEVEGGHMAPISHAQLVNSALIGFLQSPE
ncbi:alpha/beta hydrolase [Aliiglaciecola sp. CAU 1673]|uniref:alpha/beta fold hydrolase n=1 Tax=Aliiglaciecola sp. CAU 1673 TaxID=3032595 RepID=UPI0023DC723A|nr:alpha/beta hydrolase [Aliiglaciecola sp. CAU 1673]MDF2179551.1 alpha/beta hydrolase [Aliiglaciecola sp. CAU 1673]